MTTAPGETTGWVRKLEDDTRSAVTANKTSWSNSEHSVRRSQARMDELGERMELRVDAKVDGSAPKLRDEVRQAVMEGRCQDLNRQELRIAAGMLFDLPLARLEALIAARQESHSMLLEAFCKRWTEQRGYPGRRELAALVMGAPVGVRLLHRGVRVDLFREDAPEQLINNRLLFGNPFPDLPAALRLLQERLGCLAAWQFTSEAVAAWVELTATYRSVGDAWSGLKEQPPASLHMSGSTQGVADPHSSTTILLPYLGWTRPDSS